MKTLFLCLLAVPCVALAADEPKPNILFILADDLGWGPRDANAGKMHYGLPGTRHTSP